MDRSVFNFMGICYIFYTLFLKYSIMAAADDRICDVLIFCGGGGGGGGGGGDNLVWHLVT